MWFVTGHAVDPVALDGGEISWQWEDYFRGAALTSPESAVPTSRTISRAPIVRPKLLVLMPLSCRLAQAGSATATDPGRGANADDAVEALP